MIQKKTKLYLCFMALSAFLISNCGAAVKTNPSPVSPPIASTTVLMESSTQTETKTPTSTSLPTITFTPSPVPLNAYLPITAENVNRLKMIASWDVSNIVTDNIVLWYPDNQQFILLDMKDKAENNFSARLYNIENQDETLLINNVNNMLMSPDGKNLVVVVQGDLLVYDLSGEFVKHTIIKPPCNRADFFIADWIPQSEIIVFGITDGKITYNASIYGFDATTGKCLGILSASDGWGVSFLKGNPSGDLLSASIGGGIKVLDINTKKEVCVIPGTQALFKSSREIVVVDDQGTGKLSSWDVETCKIIQKFDGTLGDDYSNMAINMNSQLIVIGSHDLTFWDANSGKELNTYKGAGDTFSYPFSMDLAFSPDGRFLVSTKNLGKDKNQILVWGVKP